MDKQVEEILKNKGLLEYFNKLAPSHKNKYLAWIKEARKENTRINRIMKMTEMLRSKIDK